MSLITVFIVVGYLIAINAEVTTVYLSELCPWFGPNEENLELGTTTESFSSTAMIKAAREIRGYTGYKNCKLNVSVPHGHHIVASVRRLQFRGNCVDNMTIYADDFKHTYCGLSYDQYEMHSIAGERFLIIEFRSGTNHQGEFYRSIGFQLTVTAYRDAPCNRTTEFSCGNDRCVAKELNCSELNHCGDGSNQHCATSTHTPTNCSLSEFTCENGDCISPSRVCDGYDDCGDLSDEINCNHTCSPYDFTCTNGNCISRFYACDGIDDCGDFSDEEHCNGNCLTWDFACYNGECVRSEQVCNHFDNCGDGSDEFNCTYTCEPRMFTCTNGYCVSSWMVCDKYNDCGDWSDEQNCTSTAMEMSDDTAKWILIAIPVNLVCAGMIIGLAMCYSDMVRARDRKAMLHEVSPRDFGTFPVPQQLVNPLYASTIPAEDTNNQHNILPETITK